MQGSQKRLPLLFCQVAVLVAVGIEGGEINIGMDAACQEE
jgi:hypothetical protein